MLNIGGIANFTFIPPRGTPALHPSPLRQRASPDDASFSSKFVGFDTGPGNVLMDLWVARHWNRTYDENGALASKGSVNEQLLVRMLQHEYFARPAPKSTGRDLFNEAWLDSQLAGHYDSALTSASTALQDCEQVLQQRLDVLATLLALTARSITLHLQRAHFAVTQVEATSSVDVSRLHLASFIPDAHTACAYHISCPPSFTLPAHHLTIAHRSLCVEEACTTPRSCSSCNICAIVPSCLNPVSFPQNTALLIMFLVRLKALGSTPRRLKPWLLRGLLTLTARQRPFTPSFSRVATVSHCAAVVRPATCRQSQARSVPAFWAACIQSKVF